MQNKKTLIYFIIGVLACGALAFHLYQNKGIDKYQKMMRLYEAYRQDLFPQVKQITASELAELKKDCVFVDVREKREQEVSMINPAITQQEFEKNIDQYKDKMIVLYCTIGNRSGRYAKELQAKGIKAYNLAGGILAWAWRQLPLYDEKQLTSCVHVYGKTWDLLPDNYDAIY